MATAYITWAFVPGSLSTLVEYKLSTSTVWVQPTSPSNPTTGNTYPLDIADNLTYNVRLTTNAATCAPKSITFNILHPASNCCPAGYTLSVDETYCYKYNDVAATPPSSSENTVAVNHADYSVWGSVIYSSGYNINGTGTFVQIPYTNPFWVNGSGYPVASGANTSNGPLNRTGLWATTTTDNQDVGFTVCITLPADGIYYIGTGADNYSSIYLDGTLVLQMDPTAIGVYMSANGYPGVGPEGTFRFWHIYPVSITAGSHVLEIVGHNVTSVAAFGTEIYNATPSDLISASSYVDLGSKLIFSTKDYIGTAVQIGTGGIGYTCPSGYSLVLCEGPAFCRQTLTTNTISC